MHTHLHPGSKTRIDLGNEYTDGGGAYGTVPDRSFTEGSISVQPAPPPQAKSVTLELTFSSAGRESTQKLSFSLPR
ncbi:hypothetical protein SMC26_22675 [Actinomadura fulvescens]|uniref:Uncharacterized protein n=1 Tax=Actinomadura fulvescens TaxID=46160 RepID=A0ABP6D1N6_9ACTN